MSAPNVEVPTPNEEKTTVTIYVIQEFFVGQWSDVRMERFGNEYATTNKKLADSVYGSFRNTHHRKTRLIERTETRLAEGKQDEDRW